MSAEDDLIALKAQCLEGESEEEHAAHAAELAAAYLAFQRESMPDAGPSPMPESSEPREVALTAEIVATANLPQ